MRFSSVSLAIASASAITIVSTAPLRAQVDAREPGRFIDTLADTAFATLRHGSPTAARAQFRTLLGQYFDVGAIGDRLIQRHRARISPVQYARYKAAFPGFIIGTYGARLQPYANADLKVLRVVPRGTSAVVMTNVSRPGSRPSSVAWTVTRTGSTYQVSNLSVGGVNLGLAQQADFDSYIQRNGFDGLIAFMSSRS